MLNNDSYFVRHESCPKCGSRDNLSVWSDGHKYCFGCGYYVTGDGKTLDVVRRQKVLSNPIVRQAPKLPSDASMSLPKVAVDWIEQAHLKASDAIMAGLRWSQEEGGLIIPIYDEDNALVMYQIRRFNTKPKYENRGVLGNFLPVEDSKSNNRIVVVVEDFLSSLRVSSFADAMPLLGSHLPSITATRLSKCYDRLLIWLDNDKKREALRYYAQYRVLFEEVKVLITSQDPKLYGDQAMMEEIFGSFDWGEGPLTDSKNVIQY